MPIIRYFVFVGALLLALLIAADRYLPVPLERAGPSDPDRTIIRIVSARTLPEKIVFDTRPRADLPTIAQADPLPEEPRQQVREAMAAMPPPPSVEVRKEAPARASAAVRPHPKRSAKLQRKTLDRRLAFERADSFAGGWW
ncbi:hypothetical protein A5906_19455 [Bradyrhizobium sacchari]|uniref:Uncharacterized protein n=1 Tax=Bradyrhizobium sacchari TaxID=1399419 RepID=A0A560KCR5_9BRAD|nr:hypothetical protein [Bradyrhizobium sacchari]OPZ00381.1 hypothetical protein A5906_19455 [Bradyrhizobium sacchari]TWB64798.1 hypothetical protein FBZ94_102339 [Bradyrhizobium sacchari]TWB81121.1 hypothetical protein FBZ95_102339 [Bradyrhizobium sacchari]